MFKKILFILLLASIVIGVGYAAESANFTVTSEFEDIGDGVYVLFDSSDNADEILSVINYTEHDWEDYSTNDTENNYTVFKGKNNIYNYTDRSVNEKGSFELIKIGKDKFIIDFSKIGLDGDFTDTYENLLEFNSLNNVKPVKG